MSDRIIRRHLAVPLVLGLGIGLTMPPFVPTAGAQAGVGASGTIGRGTNFYDREYNRSAPAAAPVAAAPVLVYVPAPETALPAPAPAAVAAADRSERAESRPHEVALNLPALARRNPYLAYHRAWVHGYWSARIADSRLRLNAGFDGSEATSWHGPVARPGMGLGWGIPAWFIGPMVYAWGYFPYDNPFYRAGPQVNGEPPRFDDYSHAINVQNAPPTETLLFAAHVNFRSAREAFRRGELEKALRQTEEALVVVPDDPILHQFRALILFAMGRYDESAAATHAVLAVEPGWDWTTMVSVYDSKATYARQLRLLEEFTAGHPRSAEAHFLLAYHYLTTGYVNQAVDQWQRVLVHRPGDRLSAGLVRALQPQRAADADRLAEAATSSAAASGKTGKLEGTWVAHPAAGTTITLVFQPEGRVVCKVRQREVAREFMGYAIYEKSTLSLSQDQDNALVGTITWEDEQGFNFRLLARWPGDPGLEFEKSR